jgi:hypothetical protein
MQDTIHTIAAEFRNVKQLADRAIAQTDEGAFFAAPDPDANSVAILVKHMAGNLRSRWTDFLTTDGEKPDRDRDGEFEIRAGDTRERLLAAWESGWGLVFDTLAGLNDQDLGRTVQVRWESTSVLQALLRQLGHAGYHAGQIVLLSRMYAGAGWTSLTIPRGASDAFNERARAAAARRAGETEGSAGA